MKSDFFLSCDWGTTHFRLRLVNRNDGSVVDELKTADGVARMAENCTGLAREQKYEQFFVVSAEALLARNNAEVSTCVISGMASSRLGWRELPYAPLPQPMDGSGLVVETLRIPLRGKSLGVLLVSGLRSEENVMRGEEVEFLGLERQLRSLSGENSLLIIMPGTHSKHVKVSSGMIADFDTFMTGELFACLQTMPTLRDCVQINAPFDETHPWFLRGLQEAASHGFFKALFKIRSRNLLAGMPPADGAACLSGLLIGTEMLQAHADADSRVLVAVSGRLSALYSKAAEELGLRHIEFVEEALMDKATVHGHLRILENRNA